MTEDLARALAAALEGRARPALAALCAPEVVLEDPLAAGPLEGLDAVAGHVGRLWEALPDLRCTALADPLGGPDGAVAVALRLTGTHLGETGELPATGRRLELDAVLWCACAEDGRLRRVRAFYDALGAGRRLGLLPARGGAGERALLLLRGFGLRG